MNTLRCRLCSGQSPRANSLSSPISKTNTLGSHPILRRYGLKMALHQTFRAPCCLQDNAQNTKFLSWAYSSGCPDPSPPSQHSSIITSGSFLSLGTPDWSSWPISSSLGKIPSVLFLFLYPSHIMYSECVGSIKVSGSNLCDQAEYPVTETPRQRERKDRPCTDKMVRDKGLEQAILPGGW